jgi:hypothetical protein
MAPVVLPAVSFPSSFIQSWWPSPLTLLEPPDPTVTFPAKAGYHFLPGRHLSLIDSFGVASHLSSRAPGSVLVLFRSILHWAPRCVLIPLLPFL